MLCFSIFLRPVFPFLRILSWQAQQTLAQKSEPGREPAPRLTPARPPRVRASASLPPLSSGPRAFQRHSAFHRGEGNLRPQPSLFRASMVLSFLVRKKSLQEPLQKEQLSPRGGPSPGEGLQAGLSRPRRLQTPAFSLSTASAGLGCVPPAPPGSGQAPRARRRLRDAAPASPCCLGKHPRVL